MPNKTICNPSVQEYCTCFSVAIDGLVGQAQHSNWLKQEFSITRLNNLQSNYQMSTKIFHPKTDCTQSWTHNHIFPSSRTSFVVGSLVKFSKYYAGSLERKCTGLQSTELCSRKFADCRIVCIGIQPTNVASGELRYHVQSV